jgi:hypothetical protein
MRESERFGYSSLLSYGESLKYGETAHIMTLEELMQPVIDIEIPSDKIDERTRLFKGFLTRFPYTYKRKEVTFFESLITRGYLLDSLIDFCGKNYGDFLNITGGYDKFIKFYAEDLDNFYHMSLRELMASEDGKDMLFNNFDYNGDDDIDSIIKFLESRFARRTVPFVKLHVTSLTH